jgi:outer membrane protein
MKINTMIGIFATYLCLFVGVSHAQEKSQVSIGFAYIGSDSIYANVPFESALMPTISYKSDTLNLSFQQGAAYKFIDNETLSISAAIIPRFRPYKSTDSAGLSGMTRDMYFDGALNASYELSRGLSAQFKLGTELTNKFNGNFLDLSLSQFIPMAGQPIILKAGATWYSSERANYLYGVNASEANGLRAEYAPQSVLLPYISVNKIYSLTKQTSLFANINMKFLPSKVVNSPIINGNTSVSSVLGLNYSF